MVRAGGSAGKCVFAGKITGISICIVKKGGFCAGPFWVVVSGGFVYNKVISFAEELAMWIKKYIFVFICICLCAGGGWAQANMAKQGANRLAAKAARRAGVVNKVGKAALSNPQHRALLRREERLEQILEEKVHAGRVKNQGHLAGGLYPNTSGGWKKLETNIPGFVFSWPKAMKAYSKLHNGAEFFADVQPQISAMYPNAQFSAAFVASFDEVLLLERGVRMQGVSLPKALDRLDELSCLHMPGYAVVMVDNGAKKLRDILILDIKGERVISLHQSQGRALARLAAKRRQAWRKEHPKLAARLDKQGFALDAKRVLITKDGITWAPLPHGDVRRNLVYAWEWGWYAQFKHGTWQVEGFAEKKGDLLQKSVPALKAVF